MSRLGMRVDISEVIKWAVESLERSGYRGLTEGMHPEDWAAAITPAIEAVAIGFAEGYRRGLYDGKAERILHKDHLCPDNNCCHGSPN